MKKQLYIVDGYNMIGAWPELVALKKQDDLESARDLLIFHLFICHFVLFWEIYVKKLLFIIKIYYLALAVFS